MNKQQPVIKNEFNEKIDTWVEVPVGVVKATVIMVHGFGTSKHETAGYFDDISKALTDNNFRVVRFDFSGYGKSEGKQEDACYSKHVGDLRVIIDYVTTNFNEPVHILAQSMGCFVTALANPGGISKTLMTGIPNTDTQIIVDRVVARFGTREGAVLNFDGISLLPRSTGKIQKIGAQFWKDIKSIKPVEVIKKYSLTTQLHIIHWLNDEIIGRDWLKEYSEIPTLKTMWLPGNHSVERPEDRSSFIKIMLDYYNQP